MYLENVPFNRKYLFIFTMNVSNTKLGTDISKMIVTSFEMYKVYWRRKKYKNCL